VKFSRTLLKRYCELKCEVRRYAGFCARSFPRVTVIPLGHGSPTWLDATHPPTPRTTSTLAYSVLLRAEIARFTQSPSYPRL